VSRVCLYYRKPPETDRWLPGDRYPRAAVRRLVRGRPRPGGIDRVFLNLCAGLDRLGVSYAVNLPFRELRSDDRVGVLGRGRSCLDGYDRDIPIVAGIGLMTHPSEWPSLCDDYPVATYLQHSEWTRALYVPYFGERCGIWAAGMDEKWWSPDPAHEKTHDILVYDKVSWDRDRWQRELLEPVAAALRARGLRAISIRYGEYSPDEFRDALRGSRAMLFLSPHESQGFAYLEALSTGVPVLAWDPGMWMDPNRFAWGVEHAPATSVPFFDDRCGLRFTSAAQLPSALDALLDGLEANVFRPRDLVLESLTLETSATHFLAHLDAARRN
jgi:hypothetical protein